jgi:hypothetical protein
MKHTFPNDVTIEGTYEQIRQYGAAFGYSFAPDATKYYASDSKGEILLISEMNKIHLRNALIKKYREAILTLNTLSDEKLISFLRDGIQEVNFQALVGEFYKRVRAEHAAAIAAEEAAKHGWVAR